MIEPNTMRDTLRFWASGVAIVTTTYGENHAGMTVSAFNSLSLEPPLILICLHKDAVTAQLIKQSNQFAVSILGNDHAYLSDRFAGRIPLTENEDRFDGVPLISAITGSPILAESVAWLDCKVHEVFDGSTHWIITGLAMAAGRGTSEAPLIYYDRNYRMLMLQTEHS